MKTQPHPPTNSTTTNRKTHTHHLPTNNSRRNNKRKTHSHPPTPTLFIHLIKKERLNKEKLTKNKLPNTIYIVYTIQYKKIAEQVKKSLTKQRKTISGFSQVLGCTKLKTKHPILLITDGSFHAQNLLSQNNQLYQFDNHSLIKLDKQPTNNKNKTKLSKFYSSDKLGILISTKKGQYNIVEAQKAKQKLSKQNKKSYLFLADNINTSEFENFNIDFYINTACPGIERDSSKILNVADVS